MFARVATGVRTDAAAATATLIRTGRAETPMSPAAETATARLAQGPMGTVWRARRAAGGRRAPPRRPGFSSSAPHGPPSSSVSPTASTVSPSSSVSARWTAITIRSPLLVTVPGNASASTSGDRGGITHLGHACLAREQRVVPVEGIVVDERAGVLAQVVRNRPGAPLGDQPPSHQQPERDGPEHQRDAHKRERDIAEGAYAGPLARPRTRSR